MFKKTVNFFKFNLISDSELTLREHSGYQSDKAYEANAQDIAVETLRVTTKALNENLRIAHQTKLIGFFALLVAIIIGAASIWFAAVTYSHDTYKPNITVQVKK